LSGKLYIHCGLHKTGTTALQTWLASNDAALKAAGWLFPKTGRIGPHSGQHNLAWELTRDRRFAFRFGHFPRLRAEIEGFDGDVILSSEDFESLLPHPDRWGPIVRLAHDLGRSLVLVIYLREQGAYLESLYYQCLKAGLGEEYRAYAREALALGAIARREWAFQFDYLRAATQAARLPGCQLILRNYHALEGASVVADFFSALGLPPDLLDSDDPELRVHLREQPDVALTRFYRNRIGRALNPAERHALERLAALAPTHATPPSVATDLAARFGPGNAALCDRYGIDQTGLVSSGPAAPGEGRSNLARVFSLETQLAVSGVARRLADAHNPTGSADMAAAERQAQDWADWTREW